MRGSPWGVARYMPSRPTLLLVTGGVLLPNALALLADIWVGIPPRTVAIAAYAAAALLSARLPRAAAIPLFLTAVAFDALAIVGHVFFLNLDLIIESLPILKHVRLMASPFYIGLLVALTVFLGSNLFLLIRCRDAMARGNRLVFAIAVLVCLAADIRFNGSVNMDFGPAAGLGQPFQSGVEASGFATVADPSRPPRNALLVLVESLGVLVDPAQRAVLFSAFDDETLKAAYTITMGTTTFFGPTAHGEMRELCHSREPYQTILDDADTTVCLPDLFAARGYRTVSVHGFTSAFYDRKAWYPKIGFVKSMFPETVTKPYLRRCGGPFVGFCDVDVADRVSDRFAETKQPLFQYWLTLNSHVPVRPGEATRRHACETGGPFGDPEVCAMAEIWEDLFAAVSRLALRNPETEILLVGDHAPPLWRRAARSLFEPDRVPWIRLSPRAREKGLMLSSAKPVAAPMTASAAPVLEHLP